MSQHGFSGRFAGGRWPRLSGLLAAGLVGSLLLGGCGSTTNSSSGGVGTSPLTFANTSVPVAYVGEEYQANLMVSGGVGPYGYRLASGSLPPGMRFSSGSLSGKPTAQGTYTFTVEANDANLSNKVSTYTLNVNDLPPLALEATLPSGEIRGETRIPVVIKAPRSVRAASLRWDLGANIKVTRVQAADNSSPVFWRQDGQVLRVDMGFKAVPRSGARIMLITVKPGKAVSLNTSNFWYESRDGAGKLLGEKKPPESVPAPAAPTPADPAPAPTKATGTESAPAGAAPANAAPAKPDPAAPDTPAPTTPGTPEQPATTPPDGTKK